MDDRRFPPTEHLERIHIEVKERLQAQITELDDLQRLVSIVLTANGVLLGLALQAFPGVHHPLVLSGLRQTL